MTARTLCSSLILIAALGMPAAATDTILTGTIHFTPQASCPSCTTLLPTAGSFTYDQTTSTFINFTVTYDGVVFDFVHDLNGKDSANNPTLNGSLPCLSGATGGAATFALLTVCSGSAAQQSAGDSAIWYTNSSAEGSLFDFYLGGNPGAVTIAQSSTGSLPTSAGDYSVTLSQSGAPNTPSITVLPTALKFQILQGSTAQSQAVSIGGTGGVTWQATATTSTGDGWLSISPVSGQIPASITVSVNASGLAAGSYQGAITIESPGPPPSSPVSVSVALIVATYTGQAGIITTVAGNGEQGFSGDGGAATLASLNLGNPSVVNLAEVAVDASGNLFIADSNNSRIRKVSANGVITTVAGDGATGSSGDGGPATSGALSCPTGLTVDTLGNVFIGDLCLPQVRKVSFGGVISTVAGNGIVAFSGDGGPATSASLLSALGVAVDATENVYVADLGANRIRKVSLADGIITTVAGSGGFSLLNNNFSGDGGPATSALLSYPEGIALDASGNLYIADSHNNRVRKVLPDGIITTVAGNGSPGFSGDGGPAISASLNGPAAVAVDASGNLFIADEGNSRVRKVSVNGLISTVAGNGSWAFSGDGGPATAASLFTPTGVAVDASGNLYIADSGNDRVREVFSSSAAPRVNVTSVGNGASFTQSFAPGMLMSVFGTGLSTGSPQTVTTVPLPLTSLSGTSVTINGISAPLLYISTTQINLQIPYEVSPGTVVLTVNASGQSASISFTIQAAAPGIFVDSTDGNIVPNESAAAGTTIEVFLTGAGQVTPSEATGNVPDEGTTPLPNLPLVMTIGGVPVTPVYVGIPDWSVGVLQINFTVPSTLGAGTYPVIATIGGVASPAAMLTVTPAPANSQCTDIGGSWNASESGSASFSIVAPIESDSFTDPISGGGSVTITQTGCSIQYEPIGESGLIGTNLTTDQLASALRTGTVSGNNVSVTGIVALVDTVAATQAGLTITNVSNNLLTASGQVTGNVMTLTESGNFKASGTYSLSGQTGSFTLTITTSSTATFDWASGTRPDERAPALRSRTSAEPPSLAIGVVPDQERSSATGRENISGMLRNGLQRALVLANR